MTPSEPHGDSDWCEASVPRAPTDATLPDESLRKQIVEFLQAASIGKLKAVELEAHAASIVQAWIKHESKGDANQAH